MAVESVEARGPRSERTSQEHLWRDEKSSEPVLIFKSESAFLRAIKDDLSITAAYPDVLRESALLGDLKRQTSDPSLPSRDGNEHFGFLVSRRPAFLGSQPPSNFWGDSI